MLDIPDSGTRLNNIGGPLGLLDFVLRALRPCDPRNSASDSEMSNKVSPRNRKKNHREIQKNHLKIQKNNEKLKKYLSNYWT